MKEEHGGGNMKDLKQHKKTADPSSADKRDGFAVLGWRCCEASCYLCVERVLVGHKP